MNSGGGELTLFTSASCFISAASELSVPVTVVTVDSVSKEEESELLPSLLLALDPGDFLLSTARVFCICLTGEDRVGIIPTLFFT